MPEMTATIPHQLGKAEAKRRIESHIAAVRQEYSSFFSHFSEHWTEDTMGFSLMAMGQQISGRIVVADDAVHVAVELPWMLKMLEHMIRPSIEREGRKMLENK
jgi:hypothetical protein